MIKPADGRPGYTTAEDKREFVQVTLAGWRFERRMKRSSYRRGEYAKLWWYIEGPVPSYATGPFGTRREAVQYIIAVMEDRTI